MMSVRKIVVCLVISAGLLAYPEAGFAAQQNAAQTEQAAEKTVEKVTEKAAEKAMEKAAEKAVEKAEEIAAEKAELKAKRPDEWKGPTQVHFLVFVIDIDNIDGAAQSFAANIFVSLRWKDERLAQETASLRQMSLDQVWNPRVVLVNEGGIVRTSMPEVVEVSPDGTVTYRQRYYGPLSQPLKLSQFPMDQHRFTIRFAAAGYRSEELDFVPEADIRGTKITGGGISGELSLPDWTILEHQIAPNPYEPVKGLLVPGFTFEFIAKRSFPYYLWQVVVPLLLIVMMSSTVFWIDPTNVGSQIGIATSSIFTLIAYRFVMAGLLPRLPYMTKMDYFILASTLLVFMALVEVIVTSSLVRSNRERLARNIDRSARVVFLLFLLLVFGWFLYG
jgi:hypothetical protein